MLVAEVNRGHLEGIGLLVSVGIRPFRKQWHSRSLAWMERKGMTWELQGRWYKPALMLECPLSDGQLGRGSRCQRISTVKGRYGRCHRSFKWVLCRGKWFSMVISKLWSSSLDYRPGGQLSRAELTVSYMHGGWAVRLVLALALPDGHCVHLIFASWAS